MVFKLIKYLIKKLIFNLKFLPKLLNSGFLIYLSYLIYKRIELLRKKAVTKTVFKNTYENRVILNQLEPIDFIPSFFIPSYLTQAGFHEYKSVQKTFFKREYILTKDKGLTSLDWVSGNKKDNLLIIVHGMTGGSESLYIRDISEGFSNNYSVVTIHARGINDTPLITPFVYCAASTEDVANALRHLRKNYSFKHVFLMGISMGANITYKLLANNYEFNDYLTGFINISNFFHQLTSVQKNKDTLTDYFLVKLQKGYLHKYVDILKFNKDIDYDFLINKATRLEQLIGTIGVKMFKYESEEDYYRKTESGPDIDKIKIKTLILVAKDDPIVMLYNEDYSKSK